MVKFHRNDHRVQFTGLKTKIDPNIHLLTLENWGNLSNNEILVRFENYYQSNDASSLAAPAQLSLLDVFSTVQVNQVNQSNLIVGSRHSANSTHLKIGLGEIDTFVYRINRNLTNAACTIKWQKRLENNKLPQGTIRAGHEANGETLYICRHKNMDLMPGKYSETIKCHLSYGGKEIAYNDADVEMLTSDSGQYQWVPRHGGDPVSDQAYLAGQTAAGLPLYVGRCSTSVGLQVGKIDQYFYYPFGGSEHKSCVNHEILVC